MFAIETDLGRFEAETEREAKTLLRKAERAAAAQAKVDEANRAIAQMRAESRGFNILCRKVKGKAYPRFWEFRRPGAPCGPKLESDLYTQTATYETPQGYVTYRHVGYRVLGTLCDGGGYTIAVFTHEIDRPEAVYCLAIGAEAGQVYFVDVPGVLPADFAHDEATAVA